MAKKLYDKFNGREVWIYTIKKGFLEADICEAGARINALRVRGVDVALGFNCVADYIDSGCYAGATIGRVANRIGGAKFVLDNKPYFLNANDGKNHLHGGNFGFDKKHFTVTEYSENSVTMECESADGEEFYPGNLRFSVKFYIENNTLNIEFAAQSDKTTPWCPTNHAYFNLDGETSGDCRGNVLQINADFYTPVDAGLIPTGEKAAVKGTAFDFTSPAAIGGRFSAEELKATAGYDHNYVLSGELAASAESGVTGIKLDVYTDMPCIQFYSGGMLDGCAGKTRRYGRWAGFCLEPQYCPNAFNMSGFEKPVLKKGERGTHYIRFDFSRSAK